MKSTTIILGGAAIVAVALVVYKRMQSTVVSQQSTVDRGQSTGIQSTALPVTKAEAIAKTAIATALKNIDTPVALPTSYTTDYLPVTLPGITPVKIVRTGISGLGNINPSLIL